MVIAKRARGGGKAVQPRMANGAYDIQRILATHISECGRVSFVAVPFRSAGLQQDFR